MANKQHNLPVIGSVSLYGTTSFGAGYLAFDAQNNKIGGDGEPKPWRTLTAALWRGMEDIKEHAARGLVEINYDFPNGPKMATLNIATRWPYFGDVEWQAGAVYTIKVEDLIKHAEPA